MVVNSLLGDWLRNIIESKLTNLILQPLNEINLPLRCLNFSATFNERIGQNRINSTNMTNKDKLNKAFQYYNLLINKCFVSFLATMRVNFVMCTGFFL